MSVWRSQLRIAINRPDLGQVYKWSNLYYLKADSLSAASILAQGIWAVVKGSQNENSFCYETYTSDLVPDTTNYEILAVDPADQPGVLAGSGGFLPPFNVCRVELNVSGGRPSRKYVRGPWQEGDITLGQLNTSLVSDIGDNFNLLISSLPDVCDESGNPFTSATVKGITSRRLGKFAFTGVPSPPA